MSMIEFLLSRFSWGSLKSPGPDRHQLKQILSTAMRAPDHGSLRPWRYIVIDEAYRQLWVEQLEQILSKPIYHYPAAYTAKLINVFSQAPIILALAMYEKKEKTNISIDEQLMAASAANMNILNAVHALGFAAKWITGPIDNPEILEILGMDKPYRMLGFMIIGTSKEANKAPARVSVDHYVSNWQGKAVHFDADHKS